MEYLKDTIRFFRIAVRFSGIARLDLYEVVHLLRGLGYNISAQLPPRSFKSMAGGSGPIAFKGDLFVDVNTDTLTLGLSSSDPEKCINEFIALEKEFAKTFEVLKDPQFYEVLVELEIKTEKIDLLSFLQKIAGKNPLVESISNALGEEMSIFGYRLSRKGSSLGDLEWIDVEIRPHPMRPKSSLYVSMVYRSHSRENAVRASRSIKAIVEAISDLMTNT